MESSRQSTVESSISESATTACNDVFPFVLLYHVYMINTRDNALHHHVTRFKPCTHVLYNLDISLYNKYQLLGLDSKEKEERTDGYLFMPLGDL